MSSHKELEMFLIHSQQENGNFHPVITWKWIHQQLEWDGEWIHPQNFRKFIQPSDTVTSVLQNAEQKTGLATLYPDFFLRTGS